MKTKKIFSYLVISSWVLLLVTGAYFSFTHNISLIDIIFSAKKYILENPFQWIIFFIILYTLRPLFFIIASPFDLFSGMVFGPVYGFFISTLGAFFSTMFSYFIGNITAGEFIEKRTGKKVEKLKARLEQDTFFTALMMRLLLLPYDLWNYISWALKVPFKKYVTGTTIGLIPATFVVVSAGSAFYGQNIEDYDTLLENIRYENLWFASGFFLSIILVSQVLKRKYKNINF